MSAPYPPVEGDEPCVQATDPDVFFADDVAPAIAMCRRCPIRRQCLAFALTHQVSGVWGATSGDTRDDLRREHGIRAVPMSRLDPPPPTPEGLAS